MNALCFVCTHVHTTLSGGFPGVSTVQNPPANTGDAGLIPGWGRCPGEGNGNPLQYSCLENPRDRGAWRARWGHKELDTTEQLNTTQQPDYLVWHNMRQRHWQVPFCLAQHNGCGPLCPRPTYMYHMYRMHFRWCFILSHVLWTPLWPLTPNSVLPPHWFAFHVDVYFFHYSNVLGFCPWRFLICGSGSLGKTASYFFHPDPGIYISLAAPWPSLVALAQPFPRTRVSKILDSSMKIV